MKRIVVFLLCTACVTAIVVACNGDDSAIVTCFDIPEGGCPVQGGVECQDPTCAAAYTCEPDGGWSLAHVCPPHDGSAMDSNNDVAVSDAGYDIDAPPGSFGGPGCADLEPPDCPLGEVLICSSGCCGCEDLYVCDDGGWDPWGYCGDAGPVPL